MYCTMISPFSWISADSRHMGKKVPINRGILWNALSEPVYEAGKLDLRNRLQGSRLLQAEQTMEESECGFTMGLQMNVIS